MSNIHKIKRFLEIIPGSLSWGIIIFLILLSIVKPIACAVLIIIFDFYWIIRTGYLTTLLVMAYHKLYRQKNRDWLTDCQGLNNGRNWQDLYHLIIFPVYKEGPEVLMNSLEALKRCRYPKEKMFIIVAFEERFPQA